MLEFIFGANISQIKSDFVQSIYPTIDKYIFKILTKFCFCNYLS